MHQARGVNLESLSVCLEHQSLCTGNPEYQVLDLIHKTSLNLKPLEILAYRQKASTYFRSNPIAKYDELTKHGINLNNLLKLYRDGYLTGNVRLNFEEIKHLIFMSEGISSHSPSGKGQKVKFTNNLDRFAVSANELLKSREIFNFFNSPLIISLIGQYLGCSPTVVEVASVYTKKTDKLLHAQSLHRDINGLGWVTIFLYLSDISKKNGPHIFLPGTHDLSKYPTNSNLPPFTNAYGHDEIYNKVYPLQKEFVGAPGTFIIEDSIGLHAGKPLIMGDRLIAWCVYAITPALYKFNAQRALNYGELMNKKLYWDEIDHAPSDLDRWIWRLYYE